MIKEDMNMHSIEYWKKRIEDEKVKLGQLLEKKAIIKEDYSTDNNSELKFEIRKILFENSILRWLTNITLTLYAEVDLICVIMIITSVNYLQKVIS